MKTSLLVCGIILGMSLPFASQGQDQPTDTPNWPPVATFSILGFDPETGEVGGAVQSRVFSVGNGVLWGEADVGMVTTQAIVDVSYGLKSMRRRCCLVFARRTSTRCRATALPNACV